MTHTSTRPADLWSELGTGHLADLRWREVAAEYGWRPSSGAIMCPIVVTGRACRPNYYGGRQCACQEIVDRMPWATIIDHPRRWIAADGSRVLTSETYSSAEDIETLREICAARGITVEIGDRSPWYPGGTTLLIIRATR